MGATLRHPPIKTTTRPPTTPRNQNNNPTHVTSTSIATNQPRTDLAELVVEPPRDVAGQLQVLPLVLPDRHQVRLYICFFSESDIQVD